MNPISGRFVHRLNDFSGGSRLDAGQFEERCSLFCNMVMELRLPQLPDFSETGMLFESQNNLDNSQDRLAEKLLCTRVTCNIFSLV